jgi:hypothetical protein
VSQNTGLTILSLKQGQLQDLVFTAHLASWDLVVNII